MKHLSILLVFALLSCSSPASDSLPVSPASSPETHSSITSASDQSFSSVSESTSSAAASSVAFEDSSSASSDASVSSAHDALSSSASPSAEQGEYIDASAESAIAEAAIGSGRPVLLFFHAPWCGFCIARDGVLRKIYAEDAYPVSTYKIDYDSAAALKARYGVTVQDTVVLVDGEGNALQTITGASQSDLESLISK